MVSGTIKVSQGAYRPFGPIAQIGFAGGASQSFAHDANYWTTAITGTALNLAYTHDARGNIDGITEAGWAAALLIAPATTQVIYSVDPAKSPLTRSRHSA